MTTTVENLKNFLNSCIKERDYTRSEPADEISKLVAEWLRHRKSYSKRYVYIVWFAMRQLMLNKFKRDVRVSDVVRTMMEYPTAYRNALTYDYAQEDFDNRPEHDKMWAYNFTQIYYGYSNEGITDIYKIISIANKLYRDYTKKYGECTIDFPDEISGNLDNDDIHTLKTMPVNDMINKIIIFLQTSLAAKKWMNDNNDIEYTYNLYDWVLEGSKCYEECNDANVQKMLSFVKAIVAYGRRDDIVDKNNVHRFGDYLDANTNLRLYDEMYCMKIMRNYLTFSEEINFNDITVDIPDKIDVQCDEQQTKQDDEQQTKQDDEQQTKQDDEQQTKQDDEQQTKQSDDVHQTKKFSVQCSVKCEVQQTKECNVEPAMENFRAILKAMVDKQIDECIKNNNTLNIDELNATLRIELQSA